MVQIKVDEGVVKLKGNFKEINVETFKSKVSESLSKRIESLEKAFTCRKLIKVYQSSKRLKTQFGQPIPFFVLVFSDDSVFLLRYGQLEPLYWKKMDERYKQYVLTRG